jgi:hypothetical protein
MVAIVGLECFHAVAGFGHDVEVGLLVDDVGHAGAQQGVVVDQQDARLRRRRRRGVR